MKKILLIITVLCLCKFQFLKAQTNKGKVLIGVSSTLNLTGTSSDLMNLGFSSIKYKSDAADFEESDPDKMNSLNLSPKIGFFVANNLTLGFDVNLGFSGNKDGESSYTSNQTLLGIGPFIRYYMPGGKALVFLEMGGSLGQMITKYKSDFADGEYKTNITSYYAGIGLAAPLGDKVTFDIMAGYNSLITKDKENNEDNDRTVIGTLGLKLGFIVLL